MASTTENPNEETIKCVVVGNNNAGKTRLICARAYKEQHPNNSCATLGSHIPTVWAIDQYRNNEEVLKNSKCDIDGTMVSLRLWDTFGDHHKDRRFAYGKADIVIVCFSVCDEKSLLQVQRFWLPEIRKHCKNIPVFVVACKIDLRFADLGKLNKAKGILSKTIRQGDIIFPDKCRNVIGQLNCPYYETSVMLGFGINDVFENACRAALVYRRNQFFWNSGLKKIQRPFVQKPLQPPKPAAPKPASTSNNIKVLPKLFELYKTKCFSDVIFVCLGEKLFAHKIILSSASSYFHDLFTASKPIYTPSSVESSEEEIFDHNSNQEIESSNKRKSSAESLINVHRKSLRSDFTGSVSPDLSIQFHKSNLDGFDVFSVDLPYEIMKIIVEFCYTGQLSAYDITNSDDKAITIEFLTQIIVASQRFNLPELMKMSAQIIKSGSETDTEDLTLDFISKRSQRTNHLFLDQKLFSDVQFNVEDGEVFGHKVLLCAGCDVMNAMLCGAFVESKDKEVSIHDATTMSLGAVLGFLYSHDLTQLSTFTIDDLSDLILLADQFCLPHLVAKVETCVIELFTKNEVESLKNSEILSQLCHDVLWMMECSLMHNASNLHNWCLYFLCVHYNEVCKFACKKLKSLPCDTLSYIVANRWPPVWYIKQQDVYEKSLASRKSEDALMRKARRY